MDITIVRVLLMAALCFSLTGGATSASPPGEEVPAPPKHFLVLMRLGPQYDRSLPIQQQKGFPAHAAYMDDLERKGRVILGGPLLEDFATMRPSGGVLVVCAETPEEARQLAAGDPSGLLEVEEVRGLLVSIAPKQ